MVTKPIGYILGISKRPHPASVGAIITFGREPQNSVPLDDLMASRNHACIEVTETRAFLKDLGSFNGTFLNGTRLLSNDPTPLNSGDAIRIGGKLFYFISESAGLEPEKAAHTRTRDLSKKETLGWDATYKESDEEVALPPPPHLSPLGPIPTLRTQKIRLNKATPATLAGTLGGGSLPQIMQFIHAGAMTGSLQVIGAMRSGVILFREGHLYAANAGREVGVEAVYACALEVTGEFSFDRQEQTEIDKTPQNITEATMHVIFECCRRTDESGGKQ